MFEKSWNRLGWSSSACANLVALFFCCFFFSCSLPFNLIGRGNIGRSGENRRLGHRVQDDFSLRKIKIFSKGRWLCVPSSFFFFFFVGVRLRWMADGYVRVVRFITLTHLAGVLTFPLVIWPSRALLFVAQVIFFFVVLFFFFNILLKRNECCRVTSMRVRRKSR